MRMRRLPWAADYLKTAACRIADPTAFNGRWSELFQGRPIHLEIGCGKGGYSAGMAALYPDQAFVTIEKNESAAGLAAKKFDASGLDNVRLIYGDGADLDLWFAPGEVDVIHLNFSDPWPKKRNAKRRLSAPSFLKQYMKILKDGGRLEMKTDNAALFEYSLIQITQAGFTLEEVSVDYRREAHPEDVQTEYETKFTQAGHPIYRAVFAYNATDRKEPQ